MAASIAANLQRDESVLEKYHSAQALETNEIDRADEFQRQLAEFEQQRMAQTQRINEAKTRLIEEQGALRLEEIKAAFGELEALRDQYTRLQEQRTTLVAELSNLESGNHDLTGDEAADEIQEKRSQLTAIDGEIDSIASLRSQSAAAARSLFGDDTDPNGQFVTTLTVPNLTEGDAAAPTTINLTTNSPQSDNPKVGQQIAALASELQGVSDSVAKLLKGESDSAAALSNITDNNINSTPLERIRNKEATLEYLLERKRENQLTSTATFGGYVQRALPFEIGFHPGSRTQSGASARVLLSLFDEDLMHVSGKVNSVLSERIRAKTQHHLDYIKAISGEQKDRFYRGLMSCGRGELWQCEGSARLFSERARRASQQFGANHENTDLYRAWIAAIRYVLAINQPDRDCYDLKSEEVVFDDFTKRRHRIQVGDAALAQLCRIKTQSLLPGDSTRDSKSDTAGLLSYVEPFSDWQVLGEAMNQLTLAYGENLEFFNGRSEVPDPAALFDFMEHLVSGIYTDIRLDDSSAIGHLNRSHAKGGGVISDIRVQSRTSQGGYEVRISRPLSKENLDQYLRFLINPRIVDNTAKERVVEIADTEAVSRVLNAAVTANDVSSSLGATVGAGIVNALARSSAFKTRIPYAAPFTGVDQDANSDIDGLGALANTPYFGWTFYEVPTGIGKNGDIAYQFKPIPAQSTVIVTVPQWLRRIKATYQYRRPGEGWQSHSAEAIDLGLKGASFDDFGQFLEYEIFDSFSGQEAIHPVIGADASRAVGVACDHESVIRVSRHSSQFALCGERLYGVRNLVVGGLVIPTADITRVSDHVLMVNTASLKVKACHDPADAAASAISKHHGLCEITMVHEDGISNSQTHFAWIDDNAADSETNAPSPGSPTPAINKLVMEEVAGLEAIYRVIVPYEFNQDNPIRSIFIDKRYPFNLAKRNKIQRMKPQQHCGG